MYGYQYFKNLGTWVDPTGSKGAGQQPLRVNIAHKLLEQWADKSTVIAYKQKRIYVRLGRYGVRLA